MSFNKHLVKSLGNLCITKKVYTTLLVLAAFLANSSNSSLSSQCSITPLFDASSLPTCATPGEVFSTTLAYDYQGDLPANIDTIIVTDASTPGFEILSYSPSDIKLGRNELDVSVVYNGTCDATNLFVCDIIGGGGAADCTQLITAPIQCCDNKREFCDFELITDLSNLPQCATPGEAITTVIEYNYTGDLPAAIDTIIVLDESAPGFTILNYNPKEINAGYNIIEVSVLYDGDCNESNLFVCDVRGSGGAGDCSTIVSSTISCCETVCETIGGTLSGGPFEFCVGDGEEDRVSGVEVKDNAGSRGQWVVTDEQTVILGLPNNIEDVDFDGAAIGECFIWHVSYENVSGLEVGEFATDLTGCFSFSKGIPITRIDCDAEPCMITPQISSSSIPSCAVPGEVTTISISYDYQGELPASIDTIVVWDPGKTGYSIVEYGPMDIKLGANELKIDVVYDGDCESDLNFVIDLVGGGQAFGCNPAVDLTIPCCGVKEECVITPITDLGSLPTCAIPGEVFTTTLVYDYQGSLPAGIDTIIVTDASDAGFTILSYSPTEIQKGRNELEVSVVYDGDCSSSNLFVCDVVGSGGAADCTTTVSSPIPCCDETKCVFTPLVDLSTLPTCAVPGEVFTTTLAYDYQGSLPAGIDTIIVTDASDDGFTILSYSPTEIKRGRNDLEVSVVYDGDCNESNLFVCDVVGYGGAADCTTTVSSPIPCCEATECVFTPLVDLSTLPTCAVPGEVFTTTLAYDYQGSLPAGIDTIIVTDASSDGFTILSYSPTEIKRGMNELEVSVVYDGDCNESNLFVCDVVGYGGAADCTTTVSSPIPCCEATECVFTPLVDLSTLPTCAEPGEVFTTTLAYDYQGSLPAGIDTIIVTDASSDGFTILSYSPTEIKRGMNELEVSVVYDGDCNESNLFVCDVVGYGGAADCTTTVSSPIPCCEDNGGGECAITPLTDLSGLPKCASPGDEFTTTLAYDYKGSLPATIDSIYVTDDSAEGFRILSYSPTDIVEGRNDITVTVSFDGSCDETNLFVCEVVGGGGAKECSETISLPIPCCEKEDCGDVDTDEDGIYDDCDNCPTVANEDQTDDNDNGIGDACEEACDIEPIIEGLEIPDCLEPGEVFTTKLSYEYSGSLPASIDTIILREESSAGFEIISYDPTEIKEGVNEMEVSVVFNGDCSESNIFICDILGAGGAEACSFTISSGIKCCESNFIEIETFPNPTAGVVFVKAEERSNYMVEVFDNNGEKVMASFKEDKNFFILNTDDLRNGTYFMVVTDMETGKSGTNKVAVFR